MLTKFNPTETSDIPSQVNLAKKIDEITDYCQKLLTKNIILEKEEIMKCSICHESITDVAYIEVGATIVKQDPSNQEPIVFQSPEIRSYYNTKIYLHDRCWISLCGTNTNCKIEGGLGIIPVNQ